MSELDPFADTLPYSGMLPLSYSCISDYPHTDELLGAYSANEKLLRASSAMANHVLDSEEFAELAPEFVRLDEKLNLLIDLVSTLVSSQVDLPPAVPLRLSSAGIAWECDPAIDPGQKILIELYIHNMLPKPIKMFGEAIPAPGTETVVSFSGFTRTFRDALDKFIFQLHRKVIAATKQS